MNIDEIKNNLELNDIENLLSYLDADPKDKMIILLYLELYVMGEIVTNYIIIIIQNYLNVIQIVVKTLLM